MSPGPVSHIHRSPFTVLPLINPPIRYTEPSLLEVALTAAPYLGNGFVCDTVKFNFRCDQGYGELFSSAFSGGGVRLCRDPSRGVCEGRNVSMSSNASHLATLWTGVHLHHPGSYCAFSDPDLEQPALSKHLRALVLLPLAVDSACRVSLRLMSSDWRWHLRRELASLVSRRSGCH
jgi:hypothetical protein